MTPEQEAQATELLEASEDLLIQIYRKSGYAAMCSQVWAMVGAFLIVCYRERGVSGFASGTNGLKLIMEMARKKALGL